MSLRLWALALTAAVAVPAHAQYAAADPAGSGPIVGAVNWLQGTLLGNVATAVAVIAVACVGFLMLTGRIELRRAANVILGCFIIFGASSIAAGIQAAGARAAGSASAPAAETTQPYFPPVPPPAYPQAPVQPHDPYAGAAITQR